MINWWGCEQNLQHSVANSTANSLNFIYYKQQISFMKVIIVAISVIFNCIVLQAQQFDVTVYPEMKDWDPMLVKYKDAFYAFDIDMKGISGFSANLKRSMHNITLIKYDAGMKETNKQAVVAPDKDFGPIPPLLKVVNDKLYLVY